MGDIFRKWRIPALVALTALMIVLTMYVFFTPAPQSSYQGTEPFRIIDCMATPNGDLFHLMNIAQKLYIVENEKGERYPFYASDPYWPEQKLGSLAGLPFLSGMFCSVKIGEYLQSPGADEEARKWCDAWSLYRRQRDMKNGSQPLIDLLKNFSASR